MTRTLFVSALCMIMPSAFAENPHASALQFSVQSVKNGLWSDPQTWEPQRVPKQGDRVLIRSGTTVQYDVRVTEVVRLVQVVGTLSFSVDRDTELNVGLLTIQHDDECSEHGFACEFEGAQAGPTTAPENWPSLLVGTKESPVQAGHSARIRLHHLNGMDPNDAPAIACCSGRLEFHGSPMARTWVKLGEDVAAGSVQVTLSEPMLDWHVGDEILMTATKRADGSGSFRQSAKRAKKPQSETRTIAAIDGRKVTLDKPLDFAHSGSGEFRGEVANLSRNVIVESADPKGVRGHTVFHRFSKGGISYARFAHLGKEGVLGRYPIHFHLVGDTMRGSMVQGAAVIDSHNRWVTIHGTQYLVVQDCVGYQSVGHGFFLEDGTEVYNLLDRNLAVQAHSGRRLPKQALPFDDNEGAGFWWANGLNTITRNVTTENDEYGYRYDMQKRSNFAAVLSIRQPDGGEKDVDVRTIPIWRFEDNEAHSEGFYGMVVAANGNDQPDSPIQDEKMLRQIESIDWTGPDTRHPHVIRNLALWGTHYAFRPQSPSMSMENIRIHDAAYGIYRPAFENQVYKNLSISNVAAEPFNRGMDDASAQAGRITVDGLTFTTGNGNTTTPLIQITDVNLGGTAETHLKNVLVNRPDAFRDRWPLLNRGVGTRVPPLTRGVPVFIHDYYGQGRHAKVVSAAAKDQLEDGNAYRKDPPMTSDESRVTEVANVEWPKLLDEVDDLPPATIITSVRRLGDKVQVHGMSHDNGEIVSVRVNGIQADTHTRSAGVVSWGLELMSPIATVVAIAIDDSGNQEQTGHKIIFGQAPANAVSKAKPIHAKHAHP